MASMLSLLITVAMEKIQLCRRLKAPLTELDGLQSSLMLTHKILNMAGSIDSSQRLCLLQLKDALYEAEDVLDELEYGVLKSSSHGGSGKVSRAIYSLSSSKMDKSALYRDELLAKKLQKVKKDLDHVNKGTEDSINQEGERSSQHVHDHPPSIQRWVTTSSFPVVQNMFGRHRERQDLVAMLTDSSDHHLPQPSSQPLPMVAAIVGMGGVGKTTLARVAYNDSRVAQHFDIRIWACLPNMFDRSEITREILQSAIPDQVYSGSASFNHLQRELQGAVSSKKVLLVLDDVWKDERRSQQERAQEWKAALAPFCFTKHGSKILVTSRTREVTKMLHARLHYPLDVLGSSDCWEMLKDQLPEGSCALEEVDEQLGKLLIEKAKGLPLAVVALRRLLRSKKNVAEWKQMLDAELFTDDDLVLPSLRLSYEALPPHLQQCFAYCSLFPKGCKLDRDRLVQQWIAHGFVRLPKDEAAKTMEDVGREYFQHLTSCYFLQPLKHGDQMAYTMHNLIHDLARSVSADDCILVQAGMPHTAPSRIRHLSTDADKLEELNAKCNLENVRTLIVFGKPAGKTAAQPSLVSWSDLLLRMKRLRVLDVSSFGVAKQPEAIGKLIHLRYLALSTTTEKLPALNNLLFLQSLILPRGSCLKEIPGDVKMLTNLRHLHMDAKHSAMIPEIGRLTALQELEEFVVRKGNGDKSNLEELRYLNNLQGRLCIKNLNDVTSIEEARNAGLPKKQHLSTLSLEWATTVASKSHLSAMDAELLESLKPHPNLEVLHVTRYRGVSPPSWLMLKRLRHLKSLFLTNCRMLQVLPPLGQLPFLKDLHMKELCSVRQIGQEFYGVDEVVFPSLRDLKLDDLPKLAKWHEEIPDHVAFPRLTRLTISNCPQLLEMPPFPPTTTTIMIEHIGLMPYMRLSPSPSSKSKILTLEASTTAVLKTGLFDQQHLQAVVNFNFRCNKQRPVIIEELQVLSSLQKLTMCHCGLSNEKLSMCLKVLPCLSCLEIVDLPNITALSLPRSFSYLTNLNEVRIRNCLLLSSFWFLENCISLTCLIVERCPRLTATSFPNLKNLATLKMLSISYCQELQSLPTSSLPASLESVRLIGCHPKLNEQLHNDRNVRDPRIVIN